MLTNIHNERIKTNYIPSNICENGVQNIHKLKKNTFFQEVEIAEFPDIYDVQIDTMICINYRSVNVRRERKASANTAVLVCTYLKQGRTHRVIRVKGIFKVV